MTGALDVFGVFYDRDGKAIDLLQWAKLHGDEGYLRVACDPFVRDDAPQWLSTVWLGIDHVMTHGPPEPKPPPLIFETALFTAENLVDILERYETEADARAGHASWLAALTAEGDDVEAETDGNHA